MEADACRPTIADLASRTEEFRAWLTAARSAIDGIDWYLHAILNNLYALETLMAGVDLDFGSLAGGLPVADIGAADGDVSFVLERELGWQMEIIDHAATNMNGLRAAGALRTQLGSRAAIHDIDLDMRFELPSERYGLVLLLGILYHLQNPFCALRTLAERTNYLILSTRVARVAGPGRTRIADLPVAYLVGPDETNNDATNYWMFSPTGLERIVTRAGWSILASISGGDTVESDPSSPEHDERQFLLLAPQRSCASRSDASS